MGAGLPALHIWAILTAGGFGPCLFINMYPEVLTPELPRGLVCLQPPSQAPDWRVGGEGVVNVGHCPSNSSH